MLNDLPKPSGRMLAGNFKLSAQEVDHLKSLDNCTTCVLLGVDGVFVVIVMELVVIVALAKVMTINNNSEVYYDTSIYV
jgi:hypothetical protein